MIARLPYVWAFLCLISHVMAVLVVQDLGVNYCRSQGGSNSVEFIQCIH